MTNSLTKAEFEESENFRPSLLAAHSGSQAFEKRTGSFATDHPGVAAGTDEKHGALVVGNNVCIVCVELDAGDGVEIDNRVVVDEKSVHASG